MDLAGAALTAVALILCLVLAAQLLSHVVAGPPDGTGRARDWDW